VIIDYCIVKKTLALKTLVNLANDIQYTKVFLPIISDDHMQH